MPSSRRPRALADAEVTSDGEAELVDTTARLELHSRRTERRQRKERRRLEKLAQSPRVIMDLPAELLLEIFSLLRPSDVFALMRVNRPLHHFVTRERGSIARRIVAWRYPCLLRCFRLPVRLADMEEHERAAVQALHAEAASAPPPSIPREPASATPETRQPATTTTPTATTAKSGGGRPWRLRLGQLQHVGRPPPGVMCGCVTCTLRWVGLSIAVDFAHWQDHLDRGRPIDVIKPGEAPAWNAELVSRHAAVVSRAVLGGPDGRGDPLWHARILERHLASTVRSIRRHAANKGNRRRRFLLTDVDETAGTDAFLERSGPPTIDYPYHRDNYYMLEAYLPNRSWSGDAKQWLYVPADQHARDVAYIMARQAVATQAAQV